MPNEIEISKINKMKLELWSIENTPQVSAEDAAKAVGILVASYPQTPPADPEVYMAQLCGLLSSYPQTAAPALVDPRTGILTKCNFLPSIAEVYEWLEDFQSYDRRMTPLLRAEIARLEREVEQASEPVPPPLAVRLKQIEEIPASLRKSEKLGLKDLEWLKPLEQQSEKERRMNERFAKTQRSVPEEAMAGLKNLDNMHPGSKG